MQSPWSRPVIHDTAAECVQCRCTIAPAPARSRYIARCSEASFEPGSPEMRLPFQSSLASRAGSSLPKHALVGVSSQPSSRRTLMLPLLPAVNTRSKSDLPNSQISSRDLDSLMQLLPGLEEEIR